MLSKACEYGIKAMIFLASRPADSRRVGAREVAEAIQGPEAFTAKILQLLMKQKLLHSVKGPNGGFELLRKNEDIRLVQIVEAIDGDNLLHGCVLGFANCSDTHPCPMHYKFKAVRDQLTAMMLTTSLEELAAGLPAGINFLTGEQQ